jgi:hypothetical protein
MFAIVPRTKLDVKGPGGDPETRIAGVLLMRMVSPEQRAINRNGRRLGPTLLDPFEVDLIP